MSDVAPSVNARPIAIPAAAAATCAAAASLALRVLLIARYRFDSDETQHLHVAWAWAHGLVQYRDVFDNHMPLFHLLFAPLVRLAGENPSTLFAVRLAMLPFFALMAWLTYRITAVTLPQRVAVLATFIGLLAPDFFLCSIEFRTDVLWTASWLASIALLIQPPLTARSAAMAGLALGIAGAISAKTSLLAVSLGIAAVVTIAVTRMTWRPLTPIAAIFAAAAALPVATIAALFRFAGAWRPFLYCTVLHNVVASEHPGRLIAAPVVTILIVLGALAILRAPAPADVLRRRLFVFLTASIYGGALAAFWPIIETEHWLPFYPLAAAGLAPLMLGGERRRQIAFASIVASVLWTLRASTPWIDHASESLALVEDAMRLTSPGDHVVDLKGEFVFRPRASYWVFEKLTKRAVSEGRVQDTTIADILRTGAMVASPDSRSFPIGSRSFLLRNFVSVGCLRVAGQFVGAGKPFEIEVPGEYALVSDRPNVSADVDGVPYTAPRFFGPGRHVITSPEPAQRMALVWQRAVAGGLTPFTPDRRCDHAWFRIEERRAQASALRRPIVTNSPPS
jgi:hypothetical protein